MSIDVNLCGSAAVVTLRWTDRRNSLGPDEARAVADAVREASRLDAAAIVLTGEGAFCAGGDLKTFRDISAAATVEEIRTHVYSDVQSMIRALGDAPRPTIAAVDGPAIGLGMDLALACDMRLIGPKGWLMQGWARAGLIAGTGGVGFLERLSPGALWPLIADQPRLDGERCAALHLGEPAEPTGLAAALARAERLAAVDPATLAAYVELHRPCRWPPAEHFARSADHPAAFIGSKTFRDLAGELLTARP